jgi:hypothetical protein
LKKIADKISGRPFPALFGVVSNSINQKVESLCGATLVRLHFSVLCQDLAKPIFAAAQTGEINDGTGRKQPA